MRLPCFKKSSWDSISSWKSLSSSERKTRRERSFREPLARKLFFSTRKLRFSSQFSTSTVAFISMTFIGYEFSYQLWKYCLKNRYNFNIFYERALEIGHEDLTWRISEWKHVCKVIQHVGCIFFCLQRRKYHLSNMSASVWSLFDTLWYKLWKVFIFGQLGFFWKVEIVAWRFPISAKVNFWEKLKIAPFLQKKTRIFYQKQNDLNSQHWISIRA